MAVDRLALPGDRAVLRSPSVSSTEVGQSCLNRTQTTNADARRSRIGAAQPRLSIVMKGAESQRLLPPVRWSLDKSHRVFDTIVAGPAAVGSKHDISGECMD